MFVEHGNVIQYSTTCPSHKKIGSMHYAYRPLILQREGSSVGTPAAMWCHYSNGAKVFFTLLINCTTSNSPALQLVV
jgi:hypothetical protein